MKITRVILCILFIINGILFSSCGIFNHQTRSTLVESLQKETPFTIVTPSYFPSDIAPYPTAYEPPYKNPGNSIEISLTYTQYAKYHKNNQEMHFIHIDEQNTEYIIEARPNDNPPTILFYIQNTPIMEEIMSSTNRDEFVFQWNMNGVNFGVYIKGYSESICRKVISSMIPKEDTTNTKT
jgi:hypothetical protein